MKKILLFTAVGAGLVSCIAIAVLAIIHGKAVFNYIEKKVNALKGNDHIKRIIG